VNIPDHISKSLKTIFWVAILKFFDADPGIFLTLDPRIRNAGISNTNSEENGDFIIFSLCRPWNKITKRTTSTRKN
jgi:hypothetical protein